VNEKKECLKGNNEEDSWLNKISGWGLLNKK